MNMLLFVLIGFIEVSRACIKTQGSASTSSSQCCSINIADTASTGRFLFNPALTSCPTEATFICSVSADGSSTTTRIIIGDTTQVATGSNGVNSQIQLTCDVTTQEWKYESTTTVNVIRCDV